MIHKSQGNSINLEKQNGYHCGRYLNFTVLFLVVAQVFLFYVSNFGMNFAEIIVFGWLTPKQTTVILIANRTHLKYFGVENRARIAFIEVRSSLNRLYLLKITGCQRCVALL